MEDVAKMAHCPLCGELDHPSYMYKGLCVPCAASLDIISPEDKAIMRARAADLRALDAYNNS